MTKQVTTRQILKMKQNGEKIAMMTAYDYPTAALLDEAGMDILLIGDSLGMVVQGNTTTLPVTVDDIVYHTRMVARATRKALVIADLPFMSYHISIENALQNAMRVMQEGCAQGVKLEGGSQLAPTVKRLVDGGIPVMGHLGLTPQSVHALGGFSIQGKTRAGALQMIADAQALEAAGCFAIVLEMVPAELARHISAILTIPTIGIGAGGDCDGQVLVYHDAMGLTSGYIPKHNKRYAELADTVSAAAKSYIAEVRLGSFPGPSQTANLKADEYTLLADILEENK